MDEQDQQQISKYNSGIAIQIRLDLLWKDANAHSRKGDFPAWNHDLDCIWRELARDIKKDDWEEKKKGFNEFEGKIKKSGAIASKEPEGFKKPTKEFWGKRDGHYQILMEKELFLKRLENKLGKGTAYDDGDDDDFE